MGQLVELVTSLHKKTSRDYLARMVDDKVHCMEVARQYGKDYWDGDRRYGYGGYKYDGRWKPLADALAKRYSLNPATRIRILDVGCGKAHLLHELKKSLPYAEVIGFDPSLYGLNDAPPEIRPFLHFGHAEHAFSYRYPDNHFDLVLAMGSLHNLKNWERDIALREIERIGRNKYLWVESYRNAQEQFNLQCWALTCWAFMTDDEWRYEFERAGYTGDFEFIHFE